MSKGKERRQERRGARETFREAAEDLGVSRLELARRLEAKNEDAWAAIALAAQDQPKIDIETLIELIMAIIQILLKLFG